MDRESLCRSMMMPEASANLETADMMKRLKPPSGYDGEADSECSGDSADTLLSLCLTTSASFGDVQVAGKGGETETETEKDPILDESTGEDGKPLLSRFSVFPIVHSDMWSMYKKAQACIWFAEEIDLSRDQVDWESLSPDEKHFVSNILAFFAASDGLVNENLCERFCAEVQPIEAKQFYAFQQAIESIHAETYALLIETYIKDGAEKERLFAAASEIPTIQEKAEFCVRWTESDNSFGERLVAFACVEGIFFSSAFCSIFWLKKRGLMPGLCFSNELISRDEGLHTDFACLLHSKLAPRNKASSANIKRIVQESVALEQQFAEDSLPVSLIGMNAAQMRQYIEFVADRLLVALGEEKIWYTPNPFDWMELISLQGKSNFFEKRVGEYQKAGILTGSRTLDLECEF